MAGFLRRYMALCANDESAAGSFNYIIGDNREAIDFKDALNLHEQPVKEPEVAACDAGNGGNGLRVREVGLVKGKAEFTPMPGENEREFVALQRPVVVRKTDAAVKLRIAGQALFHTRHADENDADTSAVEDVPDEFERRDRQTLGLVENQHFNKRLGKFYDAAVFHVAMKMIINTEVRPCNMGIESLPPIAQGAKDGRCMKNST